MLGLRCRLVALLLLLIVSACATWYPTPTRHVPVQGESLETIQVDRALAAVSTQMGERGSAAGEACEPPFMCAVADGSASPPIADTPPFMFRSVSVPDVFLISAISLMLFFLIFGESVWGCWGSC
jgi:hypothetical protein